MHAPPTPGPTPAGVWLDCPAPDTAALAARVADWLHPLGLADAVALEPGSRHGQPGLRAALTPTALQRWAPNYDTLTLAERLGVDPMHDADGALRETVVALLAAPQPIAFASLDEWQASGAVRQHMAQAARRTALAFSTAAAERPAEYWHYDEAHGFLLKPDRGLIAALRAATQPEVTGRLYDFSCYRATEYVILLGLALEAEQRNPALLQALTDASRHHAIRSGQFHDVFLIEYGSMAEPLPPRYYVPGDRVWFRNPDEASADVAGYEGSWVIYLGGGRFANFWKRDEPYDFDTKCIEVFHWRHGVRPGPDGEPTMDEAEVERRVALTQADPAERARVLARMQRLRDGRGVYAEGGCIDSTREYPRALCPGTADIRLPALDTA